MKKIFIILGLVSFILLLSSEASANYRPKGHFYQALKYHGNWIELNDGLVVWQPRVQYRGWLPYSEGEWVWTPNGWYWDSYEPYGYIVYHYGRWYNDSYYGWIWVPDDQWAPAWVEWRYDDDYIGWAPLSPYALFSINIGIHFSHNYYNPYNHFHFVYYRDFCTPGMYKHYLGPKYKERIYSHTKYRTDYNYRNGSVFNRGVDPDDIRKRGKNEIRSRDIQRTSDPGDIDRNKNDRNTIRTYIASRDDFSRENLKDVEIKRSDRSSNLDVSKIARQNDERSEIKRTDRTETREIVKENKTERPIERKTEAPEIRKENNTDGRGSIINRNDDRRMNTREEVKVNRDTPPVKTEVRTERREEQRTDIRQQQRTEQREQQRVVQERNEQRSQERTVQRNDQRVQQREQRTEERKDTRNDDRRNDTKETGTRRR